MNFDGKRARLVACALFFLSYLGGCATSPQTRLLPDNPPDIPQRVELTQVPFFPQQQYHCGPSSLASIINYRGTPVEPDQIAQLIYVPGLKGSLQIEVEAATRQFEMLPVQLDGKLESLMRELAAGNPVFVLQNLGLDSVPVWHYEVVVGYDFAERNFVLRSGVNARVLRSFTLFEKTWQRADHWALAIVSVDSIPVTASADAYLDAVLGMEQVGRIESANHAYATALRRWPENLLAYSGLGNSYYAMGEFVAAETAYRSALMIDPQKAEIWNNLAYVLAQLGRHESSMDAISRALELDPDNQNFKDSYNELVNW
ncbi:MAG: PA2778 family cysteine peptidase [Gammaproteobacteria bacterium]